jgi:hypothetical protein
LRHSTRGIATSLDRARSRFADARDLAKAMIHRGWLTPYPVA